ncbi:MAG: hypothetical protein ACTHPS_04490 [Streptosporangiaceae bacterium]
MLAAVAAALPLVLAAGCSGGTVLGEASAAQAGPGGGIPAGPTPGPQPLSETGSTLLYPVLHNWAAAYRQQHANVSIATAATGSGKGMVDGPAVTGYPIVNYEYAIVSTRQRSAAKARDIKAFLHWVITEGNAPQYLDQFRFQPLPASVVSLSDAQIAKIG